MTTTDSAGTAGTAAPTSLTGKYSFDPSHTRIGFSARHAMVSKVKGAFNDFDGAIYIDQENPANSHAELNVKVASIDTRNADRDTHLRTNDFLAMDEFPEITFRSTKVEQVDPEHYKVTGDLTIRGATNPVTIDLEHGGSSVDPWGNQRIGFEGGTTINRKDWGITWNAALEAGGVMVGEKVNLEFDIEAIKAKPE